MSKEKKQEQEKEPIKFTFTSFLYVIAAFILVIAILCALTFLFGTEKEVIVVPDTTETTYEDDEEILENEVDENNLVNTNSTLLVQNGVSNDTINTAVELPESNVVKTNGSNVVEDENVVGTNKVDNSYELSGTTNSAYVPNN